MLRWRVTHLLMLPAVLAMLMLVAMATPAMPICLLVRMLCWRVRLLRSGGRACCG